MNFQKAPNFVILAILDGWGIATPGPGNAITLANPTNMNRFWASYPHTQLVAAGDGVGLPRGEAGNTETGHLNLGAGRIVYQDLERINMSIADGTFYTNPTLIAAIEHAKKNNSNLHVMGLLGAGGVHSNIEHLFALITLCKKLDFKNVYIHAFTDGRDSSPTSAKTYFSKLREVLTTNGLGQVASVMGRYWAMDRDLRWDRTGRAYDALTKGVGNLYKTPEEAIDASYAIGKTDEFVDPALITDASGKPVGLVKENDACIFFNFRIDRPRQLSRAFVFEDFSKANESFGFDPYNVKYQKKHETAQPNATQIPFNRGPRINNLFFVTMTEYSKTIVAAGAHVAFPPEVVDIPLGRVIADAGFKQLRAAESEKERFVTFYFNGQLETPFDGETKLIVPSPKVATYDLMPEMSARTLTDSVLNILRENPEYKLVVVNFANVDMVGHTGSIGAAVRAVQVVDECVGKLANWVLAYDGLMLITADHGNTEEMIEASTGEIETEHSANPVPFVAISKELVGRAQTVPSGILADVAPTILASLGISVPTSMTGRNLLEGIS